jgi:leucine-rich PPR motif-containing protein
VSFDNRMCNAHIISGRTKEYLAGIGKSLDRAKTPEEIAQISGSFPRGGAIGILEKHPELEPDCKYIPGEKKVH